MTDENTARRCKEALLDRMPIMFTQVVGDKIKAFSGQVQSVEDDNSGPQPKWRVTLIDPPARPLDRTEKLEGTEGTGKAGAFQRNAFSDAFQTGTPEALDAEAGPQAESDSVASIPVANSNVPPPVFEWFDPPPRPPRPRRFHHGRRRGVDDHRCGRRAP